MDAKDSAAPITRGELNNALLLVWTFIMVGLSTTVFNARSQGGTLLPNAIYLAAAFVMVINYAVASLRGRAG